MRIDRELAQELRARSLADVVEDAMREHGCVHVVEVPSKEFAALVEKAKEAERAHCVLCLIGPAVTEIKPGVFLCSQCDNGRFYA